MKILLIAISIATATFLAKVAVPYFNEPLLFESLESRTRGDEAVFNNVQWFTEDNKDIWMMKQSHHGENSKNWDRLAIVINKTKKPFTAQFMQLEPGPLEWSEDLMTKQMPFKVSCSMCHSNGPRAIRPADGNWISKMKTQMWNLKIKSYGRLAEHASHLENDASLMVPFKHRARLDNVKLQVKTCVLCHKEDGFPSRGTLTRQNGTTIKFLVENGLMPPFGIPLSMKEKREVENFVKGLN